MRATLAVHPAARSTMPWWRRVCKQLIFTTGIVGAAVMLRLPGAVSVAVAEPTKSKAATTTMKKATPPPKKDPEITPDEVARVELRGLLSGLCVKSIV